MTIKKQRIHTRLDPDIAEALNHHVTVEMTSGFLYLSMASWAEVRGLTGFASWFRSEATGEFDHANQFVSQLNLRGYQATYGEIVAPKAEWKTIADVFVDVTKAEHRLCEDIDHLIQLTHEKSDHFTGAFLQGFVHQQIADTAEADGIADRLEIVGTDGKGILMIDQELKQV